MSAIVPFIISNDPIYKLPEIHLFLQEISAEYKVTLHQGGPTFIFLGAKNSFPLGHKSQETRSGTMFEN
jgi:hypothetical protein